jgi:predicted DsbA family dithiol-disulfide isomerase
LKSLRIFFDFTCPYCYLAWGYFQKIRERTVLNDDWVSWEIHPEVPQEGRPIQEVLPGVDLLERKKKLNGLGAAVGLTPGEKVFVPNTHWVLSAVEFARESNKLHTWIDAVYHASFVEKKNIGDMGVIMAIARQVVLDEALLRQSLESGRYESVLLQHEQECTEKKIEWVPTVYYGEEKIIEGAFTFAELEKVMSEKVFNVSKI